MNPRPIILDEQRDQCFSKIIEQTTACCKILSASYIIHTTTVLTSDNKEHRIMDEQIVTSIITNIVMEPAGLPDQDRHESHLVKPAWK